MNAYQAAQRLYSALKADEMVKACGGEELVLWNTEESAHYGWSGSGAPTIVWEGGPYEWAPALTGTLGESLDSEYAGRMPLGPKVREAFEAAREAGFYFECINSFMLAVYPT